MSTQRWTPAEVIDRIQIMNRSGCDLSSGNAREIAPKLVSAAARCFGSWKRAVEESGIDYAAVAEAARQRTLARRSKWSKERIVECIRNADEANEPLQASLVSKTRLDLYAAACSPRYFGSWANALKAAGIRCEPSKPSQPSEHAARLARWKVELLLEKVCQLADRDCFIEEHSIQALAPSLYRALIRRFGSWGEALRAAESACDPKSKRRANRGQ